MASAKVAAPASRVLFIEDDLWEFESFRYVAIDLLGLNVDIIRVNVGDAISILTASAATGFYPYLIVLDYHLPGREGLKFLKELRSRDLPQVPVVFLTQAWTDAVTRREVDKYDAVECFYTANSYEDFVVAVWQVCSYARGDK